MARSASPEILLTAFELTKIRHYLDEPYRGYFKRTKGSPPVLPRLRAWQDESLQGAINPASEQQETLETPSPSRARKPTARRQPQRAPAEAKAKPASREDVAPLALTPRHSAPPPKPQPRKTLSLGAQPPAPPGESCDVRVILAAAAEEQDEGFDAMRAVLREASDPKVRRAVETLGALHQSFGDDEK